MSEAFAALSIPFEERGPRTDEQLEAIISLWTQPQPRYAGRFYRFENVAMEPEPVQQPRPPIWVGGNHRPSQRRAARYADAWHPTIFRVSPHQMAADYACVRQEAARAGRDPSSVGLTLWAPVELTDTPAERDGLPPWERGAITGTPDDVRRALAAYAEAGVSHTILVVGGRPDRRLRALETLITDVRPALV